MQNNITNISIPTPCHQQWDTMSPSQGGRHCDSCCKTVIDFTRMSDRQIIDFLSQSQNTCGRIDPWQISSVNRQLAQPPQQRSYWRALAATVFLMFAVASGHAQTKPKVKHMHKTELPKPVLRAKPDSMVVYHPALKFTPDTLKPLQVKPEAFEFLYGGTVGGLNIVIDPPKKERVRTGYFKSIEDMLQGMF